MYRRTYARAALWFVCGWGATAPLESQQQPLNGFFDLNGYRDTRRFSTLTTNVFANLPYGFQLFAFTNHFDGPASSDATDVSTFYSEQNLRWRLPGLPIDATAQWVLRSGDANDMVRLGARWRVSATPGLNKLLTSIRLTYNINPHVVQLEHGSTQGWRWQVEHTYRWLLMPGNHELYLAGFVDHNIALDDDPSTSTNVVVSEHQLGVRTWGNLFAVAELRHNATAPDGDKTGVGFGFQYLVRFTLSSR